MTILTRVNKRVATIGAVAVLATGTFYVAADHNQTSKDTNRATATGSGTTSNYVDPCNVDTPSCAFSRLNALATWATAQGSASPSPTVSPSPTSTAPASSAPASSSPPASSSAPASSPAPSVSSPPVVPAGITPYASFPSTVGPRITPTVQKPAGRILITAPGTYTGWKMDAGSWLDIQVPSGTVILEDFILDARGTTAGGPIWVRAGYNAAVEVRYGRIIGAGNLSSTCVNMLRPLGHAHHLDISGCEDGFRAGQGTLIDHNWVHGLAQVPLAHNDCLQLQGTESNVEIAYNRFDAPYKSPNSSLFIKSDTGNITGVFAHHNYFYGGGYSVYVYDNGIYKTTGVRLDNNVWIRGSYTYNNLATSPALSPPTQITSKVGNVYDDGSLIWG